MSDAPGNETVGGITTSADDRRALGRLVSAHWTPSAALARGEAVRFGSLTATPDGLEHHGKTPLPWAEVSRVDHEMKENGNVVYPVIRIGTDRSGKSEVWVGKQAGKFPNLDASLLLVHRLTGVGPDSPRA